MLRLLLWILIGKAHHLLNLGLGGSGYIWGKYVQPTSAKSYFVSVTFLYWSSFRPLSFGSRFGSYFFRHRLSNCQQKISTFTTVFKYPDEKTRVCSPSMKGYSEMISHFREEYPKWNLIWNQNPKNLPQIWNSETEVENFNETKAKYLRTRPWDSFPRRAGTVPSRQGLPPFLSLSICKIYKSRQSNRVN